MGSNAGFEQGGYTAPLVAVGDILCTDSSIVKPADWPVAGKTAMGIVFYVDSTDEHGWAISLDEQTNLMWSRLWPYVDIDSLPNYTYAQDAMYDFDGYSNTQFIRNTPTPSTNWWFTPQQAHPAAWAVDFDNGWYLPALGQLRIMYGVWSFLNESLQLVGGALFPMDYSSSSSGMSYWSSTERDASNAYYIHPYGNIWAAKEFAYSGIRVRSVRNF